MASDSMRDPIIEELQRARDAYAERFDYDLRALYNDLKRQEQCSTKTHHRLMAKRVGA